MLESLLTQKIWCLFDSNLVAQVIYVNLSFNQNYYEICIIIFFNNQFSSFVKPRSEFLQHVRQSIVHLLEHFKLFNKILFEIGIFIPCPFVVIFAANFKNIKVFFLSVPIIIFDLLFYLLRQEHKPLIAFLYKRSFLTDCTSEFFIRLYPLLNFFFNLFLLFGWQDLYLFSQLCL